jgi:hypothetical protein
MRTEKLAILEKKFQKRDKQENKAREYAIELKDLKQDRVT